MTRENIFKKLQLNELITLALFIAISIVLSKISFGTQTTKVGLGFIGTIMLARYFGPFWGAIGAGVADLLASAVFGVAGGFFPGFTLSAVFAGVIYGLFFYQQKIKVWKVVVAVLLVTLIVNVLMNTYWLTLMYGLKFKGALIQRLPKQVIVPWIQMVVTYLVLRIKLPANLKL